MHCGHGTQNSCGFSNIANNAVTYAGQAYIPAEKSPTGIQEAIFGFRGTMFTPAQNEISKITQEDGILAFFDPSTWESAPGLASLIADADFRQHDLTWTNPKTGYVTHLGYVDRGFFDAINPFLTQFLPRVEGMISDMKDDRAARNATDTEPIILTIVGHSLGAAICGIFTSVVRKIYPDVHLKMITFGEPREGSPAWVKHFVTDDGINGGRTEILRVVNGNDPISLIPTSVGYLESVLHEGRQLTLSFDTVPKDCAGMVNISSQYELLGWLTCAADAVTDRHLNYGPYVRQYLSERGYPDAVSTWCPNTTALHANGF